MAQGQAESPMRGSPDYVLGAGDKISVSVFGDPDLSQPDISISGRGVITLPLVHEVQAAGKTAAELQSTISAAYKDGHFLKDPQVTVIIKEIRSSPVTIAGAVGKPAQLQMQGHMTLLQGITEAGSFLNAGSKVTVNRTGPKGPDGRPSDPQIFVIQVKDLQQRPGDPTVNIDLQAGDIVTVSPQEYLFVGGAVTKPGRLGMNQVERWSILSVLAEVGNPTKVAKTENAVIVRTNPDGTKTEIPVNLKLVFQRKNPDVYMVANDILLVPESAGRKALYKAADTLSSTSALFLGGIR
jgi:polysaccharide export outer membrane protein